MTETALERIWKAKADVGHKFRKIGSTVYTIDKRGQRVYLDANITEHNGRMNITIDSMPFTSSGTVFVEYDTQAFQTDALNALRSRKAAKNSEEDLSDLMAFIIDNRTRPATTRFNLREPTTSQMPQENDDAGKLLDRLGWAYRACRDRDGK